MEGQTPGLLYWGQQLFRSQACIETLFPVGDTEKSGLIPRLTRLSGHQGEKRS